MHLIRRKLGARGKISWYNSGSGTFTFKTRDNCTIHKALSTYYQAPKMFIFSCFQLMGNTTSGENYIIFLALFYRILNVGLYLLLREWKLTDFFGYFQEEADPLDEVCGCVRWPKPFDYDEKLIPPEPNFFTTGFLMDKEDR